MSSGSFSFFMPMKLVYYLQSSGQNSFHFDAARGHGARPGGKSLNL